MPTSSQVFSNCGKKDSEGPQKGPRVHKLGKGTGAAAKKKEKEVLPGEARARGVKTNTVIKCVGRGQGC